MHSKAWKSSEILHSLTLLRWKSADKKTSKSTLGISDFPLVLILGGPPLTWLISKRTRAARSCPGRNKREMILQKSARCLADGCSIPCSSWVTVWPCTTYLAAVVIIHCKNRSIISKEGLWKEIMLQITYTDSKKLKTCNIAIFFFALAECSLLSKWVSPNLTAILLTLFWILNSHVASKIVFQIPLCFIRSLPWGVMWKRGRKNKSKTLQLMALISHFPIFFHYLICLFGKQLCHPSMKPILRTGNKHFYICTVNILW